MTSNGARVGALSSPRVQSLIGYLSLHADGPIQRSQLAYLLWPDSTETQAHTNLRKALHNIRVTLPAGGELLEVDSATIRLRRSTAHVDAIEFLTAFEDAQRARRLASADQEHLALEKAVASYGGELLPDCFDEWVMAERERLHALVIQALGRLSALEENRHHYHDAIAYTERLLEYDRWHEEAYRQLMRLYSLVGDRAAALHVYHTCATILRRELNASPALETREIYARLMQLDTGLEMPERPRLKAAARLVAREAEWKRLQSVWRDSLNGRSLVVLISGEAGIGKTRLADEMLDWAGRQGIVTGRAVCYAAEGSLALAPVVSWLSCCPLPPLEPHWLTELARVIPDVMQEHPSLKPPNPITEAWQRLHLFEALAHAVLNRGDPRLYLLDNIHWCDGDTLQWLHFLLRFRPDARLCILATARPEELERPDVADFLSALEANDQLLRIELSRLNPDQTGELASQVAEHALAPDDRARIFRDTEGVPLFIVESVRAGWGESGGSKDRLRTGTAPLSRKVHAIIAQRLSHLSPASRGTLEVAAVIGREFTVEALRPACQLDEPALLQTLDDLWKRRLINDLHGAYDFSHDKIREAVYEAIGSDRQKYLHGVVAESLGEGEEQQVDAASARIAAHFELAGMPERSVDYYLRAARQAWLVFATDDGLRYIRKALTLNQDGRKAPELFEEQGDLLAFRQKHEDAGIAYREALIACAHEDWLRRARLHRKYAAVFARVDNDLAEHAIRLAENSLGRVQDRTPEYWDEWIESRLNWLQASYWRWDSLEMTRLLDQLAPVIDQHATVRQKGAYLSSVIRRNNVRNHFRPDEETIRLARESLQILEGTGDMDAVAQGQSTMGFVLFLAGQLEEAEQCLASSWHMAEQTGDHSVLLIDLCYLSLTLRRQGRPEDVRTVSDTLQAALERSSITAYEGVLHSNRAWLEYRAGHLAAAHALARRALDIWVPEPSQYPVQWPAWSVILALATNDGDPVEALSCLRGMLAPTQAVLAVPVSQALQAALDGCLQDPPGTLLHCRRAVEALRSAGYL